MRIIIADRDAIICSMLFKFFAAENAIPVIASTYEDASALIKTGNWNFLLTGLVFFGPRNGVDLVHEAAAQGLRWLIMSGAADRDAQVEALGREVLAKPFRLDALRAAIVATPSPLPLLK